MINSKIHTILLPFKNRGDRKVFVYVPSHNEGDTMPVVYMTDGQNLFDEFPTQFGSWGVTQTVDNAVKKCVIVGIDNGNEYRDNELTPKSIGEVQRKDLLCENFTPEGELFDEFLINSVIPYIENNFPVKTDRRSVAVCGSSSGGLQAFYEGIEHSDKFSFIGAFSPAFCCYTEGAWREYLLKKLNNDMPYLYIYTGNGDELEQLIFESVEMLYDLLPEVGYPYHMMNEVVLFENEHNEKAWGEIFKDFLHTFLTK